MASSYDNDLRLNEMATGDQSGAWGTVTNLNLEIIAEAFSYGTRAIANASTDNITLADGALDADRSMYLRLSGGGQACTVTFLPATISKVWLIENATSATLTMKQGSSPAGIAIPAGQVKMIATDGGGQHKRRCLRSSNRRESGWNNGHGRHCCRRQSHYDDWVIRRHGNADCRG